MIMKTRLPWILTILLAVTLIAVLIPRPEKKLTARITASEGGRKVLFWTDPMNPGRKSDKPGKAPDGMDLVPVYAESATSPAAAGGEK